MILPDETSSPAIEELSCAFCAMLKLRDRPFELDDALWVAFQPIGPVNDGHRLLVPRRHVEKLDELTSAEGAALPGALSALMARGGIDDYNLGVNAGTAAGQTVFHLHVHVIPRAAGDVAEPRGGIVAALGERFAGSKFASYLEASKSPELGRITTPRAEEAAPHRRRGSRNNAATAGHQGQPAARG